MDRRNNGWGKYFAAECSECEKRLVRLIENKHQDPYFRFSKKLGRQRIRMAKDLIQPSDPRFKLYYKDEYDKIERAVEAKEKEKKAKAKERAELHDSYRYNINKAQEIKELIKIEERFDG